ncbi:MAG TPA: hypothetical protein VEK33_21220 [Terriglobales bacterium]|nr:hypothetical protein [Terriglobales bacterium]
MASACARPASLPYAAELRRELSSRNQRYAAKHGLPSCQSYGDPPVVCYLPREDGTAHGNFLPQTYARILRHAHWSIRLHKVHAQARAALPRQARRWRELDSANSSDALLMNIFCFPGTLQRRRLFGQLGVLMPCMPEFGVKAKVPLANGHADRTEVDMRLGELLVEAKLTEADFQSAQPQLIEAYRDFLHVFHRHDLPREGKRYLSYQLLRNVLAAYANQCSVCVMVDARRPDLIEAWYAVMRCVRLTDLRLRCKIITWQELSEALPRRLQRFLEEKYGISSPARSARWSDAFPRSASS